MINRLSITLAIYGQQSGHYSLLMFWLQVKHFPIRIDDEVLIQHGAFKGREGKIIKVYRLKWKVYVEKLTREKCNGTTVNIGVHPNVCIITKLKMTDKRKLVIDRKLAARAERETKKAGEKGKITSKEVVASTPAAPMAQID